MNKKINNMVVAGAFSFLLPLSSFLECLWLVAVGRLMRRYSSSTLIDILSGKSSLLLT